MPNHLTSTCRHCTGKGYVEIPVKVKCPFCGQVRTVKVDEPEKLQELESENKVGLIGIGNCSNPSCGKQMVIEHKQIIDSSKNICHYCRGTGLSWHK